MEEARKAEEEKKGVAGGSKQKDGGATKNKGLIGMQPEWEEEKGEPTAENMKNLLRDYMAVPDGVNAAIGKEIVGSLLQIVQIPEDTKNQWEELLERDRISKVLEQIDRACWDRKTRECLGNFAKNEVLAALQHLLCRKCAHMAARGLPNSLEWREVTQKLL